MKRRVVSCDFAPITCERAPTTAYRGPFPFSARIIPIRAIIIPIRAIIVGPHGSTTTGPAGIARLGDNLADVGYDFRCLCGNNHD
jgi:hypothetical protein